MNFSIPTVQSFWDEMEKISVVTRSFGPAIEVREGVISVNPEKMKILEGHGRAKDAIAFVKALRDAGEELGEYDKAKEFAWVRKNRPDVWAKRLTPDELNRIYDAGGK